VRDFKVNEFTACPLCELSQKAHESKNVLKKTLTKRWSKSNFVKCNSCGLIFQNPQEQIEKTDTRYGDDYFKYELDNQENFFSLIKHTLDDFDILKQIPVSSTILEIGSATGLFLKYMNDNGHKSTGVELCTKSVEYARKNYGVYIINDRLENTELEENSFDFIHFSHLIEHLNDPFGFIKKVYSLLKTGGKILITTPNSSGLFSRYYKDDWRCIVDDHLFLFNKKNLINLLKINGFEVLGIKTWGSIPAGKGLAQRFNFIKKISDCLVKAVGLGDVVAVYAFKK